MIKNSVGIWAFGPAVTRFVSPGCHYEVASELMVEKTERVAEGLHTYPTYALGAFINPDERLRLRKEAREARSSRGEA